MSIIEVEQMLQWTPYQIDSLHQGKLRLIRRGAILPCYVIQTLTIEKLETFLSLPESTRVSMEAKYQGNYVRTQGYLKKKWEDLYRSEDFQHLDMKILTEETNFWGIQMVLPAEMVDLLVTEPIVPSKMSGRESSYYFCPKDKTELFEFLEMTNPRSLLCKGVDYVGIWGEHIPTLWEGIQQGKQKVYQACNRL